MNGLKSILRFVIAALGCVLVFASCRVQDRIYAFGDGPSANRSFNLKTDNSFTYSYTNCYGSRYGYGKYKIDGDIIRFTYAEEESKPKGRIEVSRIGDVQDSIIINLTVLNMDTEEVIPFGIVGVYQKGVLQKGYDVDLAGKAKIELSSNEESYKVDISRIYHHNYEFLVRKHGLYDIAVYLNESHGSTIVNVVEECKIIKLDEDEFVYKTERGSGSTIKLRSLKAGIIFNRNE